MKKIKPKKQNKDAGFYFTVTEEQVKVHRKRSIAEIFEWLEKMNKFLFAVQTPEERKLMREVKGKYFSE